MKNRMFGFLAIALVSLVSFLGFTPAARAGNFTTNFGHTYFLDGFEVSYGGSDFDGVGTVYLSITSPTHRIDQISSSFYTDISDPSEASGNIYFFGRKNTTLNDSELNMGMFAQVNGVTFNQNSGLYSIDDYYPYGRVNRGSSFVSVEPFDLVGGYLMYYENVSPEDPDTTYFTFWLSFRGSFGEGSEGDARGMAFRAVPTPGATALFGLSGLAFFRRLRRR